MDVFRRIECYFAGFQFEGLLVVRGEPERSFQYVDGFIARVIMTGRDCAGTEITDKHHDFLSLHTAHRLAQQFSPRNLGCCSLCADICGRTDPHRHASKTGTEKQKCFVHSSLRLVAFAPFSWSVCTISLADTPRQ